MRYRIDLVNDVYDKVRNYVVNVLHGSEFYAYFNDETQRAYCEVFCNNGDKPFLLLSDVLTTPELKEVLARNGWHDGKYYNNIHKRGYVITPAGRVEWLDFHEFRRTDEWIIEARIGGVDGFWSPVRPATEEEIAEFVGEGHDNVYIVDLS
jgi:hypothetical protein